MLGNFSFGDYFKQDAIALRLGIADDEWELPPDRLFATIFKGESGIPRDDEAYARWKDFVPADRIHELGAGDNFWSMGETGPCGRCSEIHYFRGNDLPCSAPVCLGPACDCDRFVEVWNNVFMEFDRQADGSLQPLPKPSIDTGMGLERIAAIKKGTLSNYDTDVFEPLLAADRSMARWSPPRRPSWPRHDATGHLDARHRRPCAGDDVPHRRRRAAEQRVARLCPAENHAARDAARQASGLRPSRSFTTWPTCSSAQMGDAYPELAASSRHHRAGSSAEEERFDAVLSGGLPRLEELLDRAAATGAPVPGDEAFKLYDTFGLPLDFIEDLASERKLALRPRELRRGDGRRSARRRGRRARSTARRPTSSSSRPTRNSAFASPAISSRATRPRPWPSAHDPGALRRTEAAGDGAAAGRIRLCRARPHAVLSRGRRPGVGRRDAPERGGHRPRARRRASSASARGCRAAPRDRRRRRAARTDRPSTAVVDRREPRRDAPQPHGHSPAPRGPAPGARHARQAGGLARRARIACVSTSRTSPPITPAEIAEIEEIVNAQILRNSRRLDRSAQHGGGHHVRRDGAVRREVRRPVRVVSIPGLQHRAVRRHAHAARPATSGCSPSPRRAAWQPASGASRRRRAPARCTTFRRIARRSGSVLSRAERRRRAGGRRRSRSSRRTRSAWRASSRS